MICIPIYNEPMMKDAVQLNQNIVFFVITIKLGLILAVQWIYN